MARRIALEREVHEPLEQARQKHNNPVKRRLEQDGAISGARS